MHTDRIQKAPELQSSSKRLCGEITAQEIKLALWQTGKNKAPGIDGYTACFYKKDWRIITKDITQAMFTRGKMLHYTCP